MELDPQSNRVIRSAIEVHREPKALCSLPPSPENGPDRSPPSTREFTPAPDQRSGAAGRHPQTCELPHVSSPVCDPFARRWDRYSHGAVLARTCRRINHNDLPARHEASRRWWPKPPSISHNNLTDDFVSWPMPMESTSRKGTSSRRTRAKSS